jgi:3-oxoacyl-[acyl-carrier protein] reductase
MPAVALVTGANRGLGRHLALGLGRAGFAVGLLGRSRPELEKVAAQLRAADSTAKAAAAATTATTATTATATADVCDFDAVRAAVDEITGALGPIDLLVNNAGVIEPVEVPAWEADPAGWWDVVEVDLRGPFHLVRAVVPSMVERGSGRVIDLNSGAGANDRAIYSAYCAAKAGLFRLTGNLHLAGFDRGLRAFEISPGVVRTDMTASMALHTGRTEWTPSAALVDLVVAAGRGDLDAWSGCFLRADLDTPASLRAAAQELTGRPDRSVSAPARRLGVRPWGPADPL